MLVKYVSDVWHDHRAEYEREFASDAARVERRHSREPFKLPQGADFASLYAARNQDNIGEQINKALEAIEEANKAKLDNVFRNSDFNSEANLGRTPQRNERLRNLLDPQSGDRIYDPACGSGSLLIKCATQVPDGNYSLWGQEANGATWALCMMNMLLHNMSVTTANISWGDTLKAPHHLEDNALMRFDVVVANPPFSVDKWGAESAAADCYNRFWRGIPPKSKGDYAFIGHVVESMDTRPGSSARTGVIVPHGVIFRGSSGNADTAAA
jgi:type I restriction enzyme M protein